ncbi:MFS transporter [Sphingomonas sp.]|uniref:MFS transporter n=1 Tax=Sphingomonas sp. TaxID=28214 RepID=UPI002ED995FA
MIFWSLACASHRLAGGVLALAASRLLLGAGEGDGFPAATRAVAEWFPAHHRSLAMGMINAGTAGRSHRAAADRDHPDLGPLARSREQALDVLFHRRGRPRLGHLVVVRL